MLKRNLPESSILESTRISPYYLRGYLDASEKYSNPEIENAFAVLLDADVKLKSTSPDPFHLMEMLVYSLIHSPQYIETIVR
jgi:hypothetical protein